MCSGNGGGGVPAVKSMCGICVEWATFQCGIGETCTTNLWNFMRGIGRGPGWIWRITSREGMSMIRELFSL